jgi:5'-nucleotidase
MSKTRIKPVVLITNDDGVKSPLLLALAEALRATFTPVVVAPEHECSWASALHVATRNVRVTQRRRKGLDIYRVSASPVDCVHIALQHLDLNPALVISGPNFGLNAGAVRITFSATVQAALAATRLGVPAAAVSIYYRREIRSRHPRVHDLLPELYAEEITTAAALINSLWQRKCLRRGCLNINLPYPSPNPSRARFGPVFIDGAIRLFEEKSPRAFHPIPAYPDFEGVPAYTDMGLISQGLIAISPLAVHYDDVGQRARIERALDAAQTVPK